MKIKAGIIFFLILIFGVTWPANAGGRESFYGSRTTVCRITQSDLENYVSGGRTSLEMLLSKNQHDWLTYSIESHERDLYIAISFAFDSYEDYTEKLSVLIKAEPVTILGKNDQEYMENFSPVELFEFLNYSMKSYDLTEEEDLIEFMEIQSDSMEINGEVYSGTNAVDTSNKGKLTFDNIDFDTKIDESGVWIRTIELSAPEEQADIMFSELSRRCERCDASFESSGGTCTVVLSAETEKNLIEKMLIILQTDVNIRHYRYYQENGTVRNETEETINVDSILAEEGGFSYRFELPDGYENLSASRYVPEENSAGNTDETRNIEDTEVNGNIVSYSGKKGKIKYYFDEGIMFDKVSVDTDLSNELRKTARKITFILNGKIDDGYHEKFKNMLVEKLQNGYRMRIYEDNGSRFYEVSFQSWFIKDISDFTQKILDVKKNTLQIDRKIFPFSESNIIEKIYLQNSEENTVPEIEMIYTLPEQADYQGSSKIKNIIDSTETEYKGHYLFKCFHYKKLMLYAAVSMLLVIAVLAIAAALRYKFVIKKKKNQKRYCPRCGSVRNTGGKFCGKCGYKFK